MSDSKFDFNELRRFVSRVDLRGIIAQECHAVRHSGAAPERVTVSLDTEVSANRDSVDYRFTLSCEAFDEADDAVADLSVVLLASFTVSEGPEVPEVIHHAFGANVAVMTAYPYLRQHVHDLANRIGLVNFTLGLMKLSDKSQGFSIVATGDSAH
ncbi:hypothetical protein J7E87_10965 [Streptomyces sp. ISL-1]|uniref:hypothetical protein n=1 Tax=Streptomyces sp. ISL-1 TaxID=2817657 RepID=UPI001BE5FC2F|nr:hypothetical protein [Streptomyces sp. ISL-1]MBT2389928.1 hypothetical protein [Streptomyces sp. ISL-1]